MGKVSFKQIYLRCALFITYSISKRIIRAEMLHTKLTQMG